ncbi:AaceriAER426Cp [[Ashbya] aceris (nom. inval.)]|nr:AaceriAER426Cp [[Ashbya] aceris (nom. inval.)]
MEGQLVTATKYTIRLRVGAGQKNFHGEAEVQVQVPAGVRRIELHAAELVVVRAALGEVTLKVQYERERERCVLEASEDLVGGAGELRLAWVGKVGQIGTFRDATQGVFRTNVMDETTGRCDAQVVATHMQPALARRVLPCFDEPGAKAAFQLEVTCSERFKVVSNTETEERQCDGAGMQTVRFRETPRMTPSLFGFCLGDLDFLQTEVRSELSGRTVGLRAFSPQRIQDAAFALDVLREYLTRVESWFGFAYPLGKLDLVLLPFLSDLAMENFGMITVQMTHLLLSPDQLVGQRRAQAMQLLLHELVHQWMGNYISFDAWEHLWFNEAFATWLACSLCESEPSYWLDQEWLSQWEDVLEKDSKPEVKSIVELSRPSAILRSTADIFNAHTYNKGIALLRVLNEMVGPEKFKEGIRALFQAPTLFHEQAVTPMAIFKHMQETLGLPRLVEFVTSWIETPGVPILHVNVDEDGTAVVEQHRYGDVADSDLIYHIPLMIRKQDGNFLTDCPYMDQRRMSLPGFDPLFFNADSKGFYRVSYESITCYEQLKKGITEGKLSSTDIYRLFTDLDAIIGSRYQKPVHLKGLHLLLAHMSSLSVDIGNYFHGLAIGLRTLQRLELSLMTYRGMLTSDYLSTVYQPLFGKLQWPQTFLVSVRGQWELEVMLQVLFGMRRDPRVHELCLRYYKCILQGPNKSIPMELVGSIFAVVAENTTTVKGWKKLFEVVKSAEGIASHVACHDSASSPALELQNTALANLSFARTEDLIKKTLNFVSTNIDTTGIDMALFGLNYNARQEVISTAHGQTNKKVRDIVWEWYMLNFPKWARKSLRQGAESAEVLKKSLDSISMVIFQMWCDQPEKIDMYVTTQTAKFGKQLRLHEIWAMVKQNEDSKVTIYQGMLGF